MTRPNFTLVQGLRGLAALWVVLFHIEKQQAASIPLLNAVFGYGSAGVAVFFVLSGFVIAHSLNGKEITPAELGRFALRRSVRLDPPYWASMALVVAVGSIMAVAHGAAPDAPSAAQIVAHVTYSQELLHVPELQVVYWTLTYEVQFYLFFAASMMFDHKGWVGFYLALVAAHAGQEGAPHGLFVNLWHGFFLGVLAYRAGYLKQPAWSLLGLAAVTFAFQKGGVFGTPCAATALLMFAAARTGRLTALGSRSWQWLGAISYSLYLVHIPVLRLLTGTMQHVAGKGVMTGMVLVGSCLMAAWLFHMAIERPSQRLAKQLFRPLRRLSPVLL